MAHTHPVPMVRCELDGVSDDPAILLRYIPASVFDLWRFLMETRHGRRVKVHEVSFWVAEEIALLEESLDSEQLEPVLRVQLEKPGPSGVTVPVERYFPAETYPEAKEALLTHYEETCRAHVTATPGYFVPAAARRILKAPSRQSATAH
jgi:hypothetical protein